MILIKMSLAVLQILRGRKENRTEVGVFVEQVFWSVKGLELPVFQDHDSVEPVQELDLMSD